MAEPQFVYVTYIATTADRLWEALTSGDFTERYWGGGRIESTWTVGSPVKHTKHDRGLDWEGEVLELPKVRTPVLGDLHAEPETMARWGT